MSGAKPTISATCETTQNRNYMLEVREAASSFVSMGLYCASTQHHCMSRFHLQVVFVGHGSPLRPLRKQTELLER